METISTIEEKATSEGLLLKNISIFFDSRSITAHLIFFEYWMEKVLNNKCHKKYINAADLLFFTDKFYNLFEVCYRLIDSLEALQALKVHENFIARERSVLTYYPDYLRTKELCNPLTVLRSVLKTQSLAFYKQIFQEWLAAGLSSYYDVENTKLISPLYGYTKRLIGACWLIHERLISKNSYATPVYVDANLNFALSCPLMLKQEQISNPYLMIELFFNFESLSDYREDLSQWFKTAMSENICYENANDLLFIHNQFLQLIHAGFLIVTNKIIYFPKSNYPNTYQTCGHWLLAVQEKENSLNKLDPPGIGIQLLQPQFWENPIAYCKEALTLNKVKKLRYGLKEWLEAAFSKNYSITTLDPEYIFGQFENLQKIMEALYLIIVQPALADLNKVNPIKSYENE
ncbi:MAG: hypothetical protein V4541_08030 [Bacteroidota bacterium]